MTSGAGRLRQDIQGLRALAVLLVLAFHLWPQAVPGGFVGVDAFFVLSGFLITGHLRRELETTGRIRLRDFWVKRARRLLPASFTVLVASLLATWAWLPLSLWDTALRDIFAAGAYYLNWVLAWRSLDYWSDDGASPVQHFWSLSVEEQFYLLWPVLLLLAVRVATWMRAPLGRVIVAFIILIGCGSLCASIVSALSPEDGDYFLTWNRAWEFAAGGLLAFVPTRRRSGAFWPLLAALGALALFSSAFLVTGEKSYPGWIALVPVLGTCAAIAFGQTSSRFSLERLLAPRQIQWVGDLSYGIYLWHWPLIVFSEALPEPWDEPGWERGWIVLASFGLAALTKRFVEDPVRYGRFWLILPPRWTFAAVLLTIGTLAGAVEVLDEEQEELAQSEHRLSEASKRGLIPCFGANRTEGCQNSEIEEELFPEPWAGKADIAKVCMADNDDDAELRVCKRGYTGKRPRRRTAIVGDSHAGHWSAAFEQGAKERKEQLLHMMKGSCPFSVSERASNKKLRLGCEKFKEKVWAELRSRKIDRVILSASSNNSLVTRPGLSKHESAVQGYEEMLRKLPEHIREVIVMRDVPRPRTGVIRCLEWLSTTSSRLERGACSRPKMQALLPDPLADAARRVGGRVKLIDLTDEFCDEQTCFSVVGNVLVYGDGHHMTGTFARSLAPRLRRELVALFGKRH